MFQASARLRVPIDLESIVLGRSSEGLPLVATCDSVGGAAIFEQKLLGRYRAYVKLQGGGRRGGENGEPQIRARCGRRSLNHGNIIEKI